jgi:3-oxoacyl-[acyl-carrier-protein] synthase II
LITTNFPSQIGAEVRDWEPEVHMDPKEVRRNDRYTHFAVLSRRSRPCRTPRSTVDEESTAERVGVLIGSGIGGMSTFETQHKRLIEKGPRKVSPVLRSRR